MFVYVYVDDGEMVKDREDGDGQGSLASRSPWGHKESDTTEWLNNNKVYGTFL